MQGNGMIQSSVSRIAEATDATTRILTLQARQFLLKQEIKAIQHMRRIFLLGVALLVLNLLLILSLFWLSMSLHESGWSSLRLAALSFTGLGFLTVLIAWYALKFTDPGKEPSPPLTPPTSIHPSGHPAVARKEVYS